MTMTQMSEAQYLADMNRELMSMGVRPVQSIEEARRPISTNHDAFAVAAEKVSTTGRLVQNGPNAWDVRYEFDQAPVRTERMATANQINYIIDMNFAITGIRDAVEDVNTDGFTFDEASAMIDRLKPLAAEARRAAYIRPAVKPVQVEEVTEGMYSKDGVVYKVQVAKQGSGRLYAKTLTEHGFEYTPGAIRQLRPEHKMSLEQAKEYGKLYGVCCICSRDLTDEDSIAAGIGPVYAKKF